MKKSKNKISVKIVLPPVADSRLEIDLVELTKAIAKLPNGAKKVVHGLLGGEYGYGANFENGVFMMHPFCWCERNNCPWCFENDPVRNPYWDKLLSDIKEKYGEWSAEYPSAPNFYHKKSGFSVRWYKWIGRSMEYGWSKPYGKVPAGSDNKKPTRQKWEQIFTECMNSLK